MKLFFILIVSVIVVCAIMVAIQLVKSWIIGLSFVDETPESDSNSDSDSSMDMERVVVQESKKEQRRQASKNDMSNLAKALLHNRRIGAERFIWHGQWYYTGLENIAQNRKGVILDQWQREPQN